VIPGFHRILYFLHRSIRLFIANVMRILYWSPLFKSRLKNNPKRLYLFGGLPGVLGPLDISIGDDCRVAGMITLSARGVSSQRPRLIVGNNVDIGWQSNIAVGTQIVFGNNVRIAGRAFLAGYPGHPLDAQARAKGLADTSDQIGDIILEDDVWLASRVSVMAGVSIGAGSVIAAGSVVTHDIPAGVLAGGVPAKVIRRLDGSVQGDGHGIL
jgi:acetyltransferase-like isoleucine patch superfamily enzyme